MKSYTNTFQILRCNLRNNISTRYSSNCKSCQVMNLPSGFFWSRQESLNRLQEHYYKFLVQIYKIVGYKLQQQHTGKRVWKANYRFIFFTPYKPINSLYYQSLSVFGRLHWGLSSSVSQNVTLVWHAASRNPAENRLVVSSLIQYLLLCVYKVPDCRKTSQHSGLKTTESKNTYMQIATMTTFPGPCRNVALLPDRGFMKQRKQSIQS